MEIPPLQEQQSLNPRDYACRLIVAGSRGFKNIRLFHHGICSYLDRLEGPVLFISGAAPTGADHLIIQWCKKFHYPCLAVPADWDGLGKRAGFVRNTEMAKLGTHLLAYFDGKSPGTTHMIDTAMKRELSVKVINVTLPI